VSGSGLAATNDMIPLPNEPQDDPHTPRRVSFGPTQGAEAQQEGQIEPSQIPLPESPVASSFTDQGDTLQRQEAEDVAVLAAPAEDSAAPTPSAHAASPDLEGEPQVRTASPSQIASPAPPPLPRRAARRTAPVPPGEIPSPSSSLDDQRRRASSFSDRPESSPRRTSVSNGNTNGDEPEVYIGDATWEERTWKVLVRLREDMFYARLGSVR
jgi:Rab guanine nucleotide exchange factor SEC2